MDEVSRRIPRRAAAGSAPGFSGGSGDLSEVYLALPPEVSAGLFTPEALQRLNAMATVRHARTGGVGAAPDLFAEDGMPPSTEILVTGWGSPRIDATVLDAAPALSTIVHAAGTVKPVLSEEVFRRGIRVASAAVANAVPVAEFTVAAIILGAKRAFVMADRYRRQRSSRDLAGLPWLGTRGIVVGVVGASTIGRLVIEFLQRLDVEILVYDPYLEADEAVALGVGRCDLDTLCRSVDVLTLHAPENLATLHMLSRRRLALLRDGSLVVNTSRGRLVDTAALTEELVSGRLDAVLDVTDPEPLEPESPLYDLPNVFLTPHLAGSQGNEISRLGDCAVDEITRVLTDGSLRYEIRSADLARIA